MGEAFGLQMGQVCRMAGLLRRTEKTEEKRRRYRQRGAFLQARDESRKQVEGSSLRDSGMAIMSTLHSVFFRLFPRLALPTLSMV